MLLLLERMIRDRTPYELVTLANPLELPRLLSERRFDLIVTDLRMPGMSGMDVVRYVSDQKRHEAIVIMTAFGTPESYEEAMNHGVFDYLTKPFKKEQLLLAIERALRWVDIRDRCEQGHKILEMEPFVSASLAFRQTYVKHLAQKHNRDLEIMAEKSGLSIDEIRDLLESSEN
jgi:DNA-binding NtrC family response regulator